MQKKPRFEFSHEASLLSRALFSRSHPLAAGALFGASRDQSFTEDREQRPGETTRKPKSRPRLNGSGPRRQAQRAK